MERATWDVSPDVHMTKTSPLIQKSMLHKNRRHTPLCQQRSGCVTRIGDSSNCVHGAPWSVANWLHGQQTGAFSWRPMLRQFQEDRPIPARPKPIAAHLDGGVIGIRWCITSLSRSALASPDMRPTLLVLHRMHTNNHLHPCPHQTGYTHAPTVTNSSAFHAQL